MRWLTIKEREPPFMREVILAFLRPSDDKPMVSIGWRDNAVGEEPSYYCYELRGDIEPTHWMEKPAHPDYVKERIIVED